MHSPRQVRLQVEAFDLEDSHPAHVVRPRSVPVVGPDCVTGAKTNASAKSCQVVSEADVGRELPHPLGVTTTEHDVLHVKLP